MPETQGLQSTADSSVRIGPHQQLINGPWVDSRDARTIAVECPANRTVIAPTPRGGAADVDDAVQAAHAAFPAWSRVTPSERGRLLLKIADSTEARVEELEAQTPVTREAEHARSR